MITNDLITNFFSGATSGVISSFLFQPLDVLKTQFQNRSQIKGNRRISYFIISKEIFYNYGLQGFWKGLSPTLVRCIPGVGLYFTAVNLLSDRINGNPTALQSLIIGGAARTSSTIFLIPFTVLKTRFESGHYNYKGIIHGFKCIKQTEGFRGFSRGLIPTIVRDVPFSALYYMFYTRMKMFLNINELSNSSGKVFVSGVIAGCLASVVTHPADVIKTYMQLYPGEFSKFSSGLIFIQKKFGMIGYFNGLLVRLIRRTFITSMSWTVYEKIAFRRQ